MSEFLTKVAYVKHTPQFAICSGPLINTRDHSSYNTVSMGRGTCSTLAFLGSGLLRGASSPSSSSP
jgi:hypothetical protein